MRTDLETDFTIIRHGEKTPVVRVVISGDKNMVGKTFLLKKGYPIFAIDGTQLSERETRKANDNEEFYVDDVLSVSTEYLHASTWKQGTNVFLVNDNKYVHLDSAKSWLNGGTDILKHRFNEGSKKVATFIFITIMGYFIIKLIERHIFKK